MKSSNNTIGNRSRDLLVCSAVPQPLHHRVPPFEKPLPKKACPHDAIYLLQLPDTRISDTCQLKLIEKSTHREVKVRGTF
jgi:hypothetical protein